MSSSMPCLNVKKKKQQKKQQKTSLFVSRTIDTAVGGLDSWSRLQTAFSLWLGSIARQTC